MLARNLILLVTLGLVMSLGCIGADEAQQPSSVDSLGEMDTVEDASNQTVEGNETADGIDEVNETVGPNVTGTVEHGETLVWTHQRYGQFDNVVVNGGNCMWMFVWGTDEVDMMDVTIESMGIHGNWTGDAVGDVPQLEVRVKAEHDGDSSHVWIPFREVVEAPWSLALPGWNFTDPDWPLYGIVAFFPPEEIYRPLVDMRVGFHWYVDYSAPAEFDEGEMFEFGPGSCT